MHILVAYDICENRTRTKIFDILKEKGLHTQKSIFECEIDAATYRYLQEKLSAIINPETDSVLFYPLCKRCSQSVHVVGQGIALAPIDWMVL